MSAFGVEGTGAYDAGLARHLRAGGHVVIEVDRPDRTTRRQRGNERSHRCLRCSRRGAARRGERHSEDSRRTRRGDPHVAGGPARAIKARAQAINQLKALVLTGPAELRKGCSFSETLPVTVNEVPGAHGVGIRLLAGS
ncbi:hypothetical protein [Actinomycetospora lemnae]|uniref:Transposase IS111A/IS1328/IS1533 N-terminal domain-containing protein n=1 Tax=Actinomycetospora lemnae TaxID=3019891 RepID=A0ABT5STI3_9PSEU|nr:hypothetical protein [Actinomycetospora sp. DW7H6]MDD7966150.1 hypothetical protein [Actinomycetospora sp. DW7H6]